MLRAFFLECRDVLGGHVVIIEHQPVGLLPEVSQLLGISLELHAGCDAGQPVLDVLCRSLSTFIIAPVAFGIGFHRCRMHDVVLQHLSVGERLAGRGLQSLEKEGKTSFSCSASGLFPVSLWVCFLSFLFGF